MDNRKARKIATEGFLLLESSAFHEAEEKYIEAISLVDSSHWVASGIHGEFSIVLQKIGKQEAALEQLEAALNSARISDGPSSGSAMISAYFLADYQIRIGLPKTALETAKDALEECGESEWLAHFAAARAYFALDHQAQCFEASKKVLELEPSGKFSKLDDVLEQVMNGG